MFTIIILIKEVLLGITDTLSLIDQLSLTIDQQFLRHIFRIYRHKHACRHVKIGPVICFDLLTDGSDNVFSDCSSGRLSINTLKLPFLISDIRALWSSDISVSELIKVSVSISFLLDNFSFYFYFSFQIIFVSVSVTVSHFK